VMDELPEWRGSRAAWLVDGGHNCSKEQLCAATGITFRSSDPLMVWKSVGDVVEGWWWRAGQEDEVGSKEKTWGIHRQSGPLPRRPPVSDPSAGRWLCGRVLGDPGTADFWTVEAHPLPLTQPSPLKGARAFGRWPSEFF
jgi:hypothetical protein